MPIVPIRITISRSVVVAISSAIVVSMAQVGLKNLSAIGGICLTREIPMFGQMVNAVVVNVLLIALAPVVPSFGNGV